MAAVLARVAPARVLALFPAPVALPPRLHDAVTARLDYLTVPGGRCPVAYWKGGRLKDSWETVRKFVAFEHPTSAGPILLTKTGARWTVRYVGKAHGRWRSPDAAAKAAAQHHTGLPEWDEEHQPVSEDIIDWRPLGESI